MRFLFSIFFLGILLSCENNDSVQIDGKTKLIQNENEDTDIVISDEDFETKEANKLNSEGIVLSRKGSSALARRKFLEALEIEPKNVTILNSLGIVEMKLSHHKKSIKYLEEALSLSDSTYVNAAINLGLSYYYNEEYNKCVFISDFAIPKANSKILKGSALINKTLSEVKLGLCDEASKNLIIVKSIFNQKDYYNAQVEYLEESVNLCKNK